MDIEAQRLIIAEVTNMLGLGASIVDIVRYLNGVNDLESLYGNDVTMFLADVLSMAQLWSDEHGND